VAAPCRQSWEFGRADKLEINAKFKTANATSSFHLGIFSLRLIGSPGRQTLTVGLEAFFFSFFLLPAVGLLALYTCAAPLSSSHFLILAHDWQIV
jgi:hypothetical protein